MASGERQEHRLRLAQAAAVSAILAGCDPDEIRRRIDTAIAQATRLTQSCPDTPPAAEPAPRPRSRADRTTALDTWVRGQDAQLAGHRPG